MSAIALPAIDTARLPALYESAQNALAECSRIDECQQWADKAEAMASYARQSKDDTLRKMADRIQARAIRRCGELLRQIPVDHDRGNQHRQREGDYPQPTRTEAATAAGMSEHQRKTALRVAAVPAADFEAAIESDDPPTVTKLAEAGRQARPLVDLTGIDPGAYARATEAQGTLRRFAEYCARNEPATIAKAFKPHEVAVLRRHVMAVDAWLDRFITNLQE